MTKSKVGMNVLAEACVLLQNAMYKLETNMCRAALARASKLLEELSLNYSGNPTQGDATAIQVEMLLGLSSESCIWREALSSVLG